MRPDRGRRARRRRELHHGAPRARLHCRARKGRSRRARGAAGCDPRHTATARGGRVQRARTHQGTAHGLVCADERRGQCAAPGAVRPDARKRLLLPLQEWRIYFFNKLQATIGWDVFSNSFN